MLVQEKAGAIKRLEDRLAILRAEPVEETIVEHDPSMDAYRISTNTSKAVALIRKDGEMLGLNEVWLPRWLFEETRLQVEL